MPVRIITGDCIERLREMDAGIVHTCVTSPPYFGLRDYGHDGQIGLEPTPDAFVAKLVEVFREVRRVLRDDGTVWLNLGDSYANTGKSGGGSQGKRWETAGGRTDDCAGTFKYAPPGFKPKDLMGIPWRVAFALQADGWYLRSDIIWHKPNPMPESITDRPTKAHEYVFLLAKSERYYYDAAAIAEEAVGPAGGNVKPTKGAESPLMRTRTGLHAAQERARQAGGFTTRNKRTVWSVTTQPYDGAHFATFPPALVEPCILAGCPEGGTVLDPFSGAGTTGLVADRLQRNAVLIELNPDYAQMAEQRIRGDAPLFAEVAS